MTGTDAVAQPAGRLRAGIIGVGAFGTVRARAVAAHPLYVLQGVADPHPARRAQAPGSPAVRCADHRELLDAGVDVAIVSSPVHLHLEHALAALERGAHVLVEKPLSNSVTHCRRLVDAARAAGRTLAVGFTHRYFPSIRRVKVALDRGDLGALDHVRAYGGHEGLGQLRANWMYEGALSGGGAMMDIGIHLTDLTRYLFGEIVEVYGVATGTVWKVAGSEDNAMAMFKTTAGLPVIYQAAWSEWRGYTFWIDVYGSRGMIRARCGPMLNVLVTQERPGARRTRSFDLHPRYNLRERLFGWERMAEEAAAAELDDLPRLIRGEAVTLADGLAGLRAVEIAQAVYDSSRRGLPVALPPTRDS
jgi:predicted dehydrogenase